MKLNMGVFKKGKVWWIVGGVGLFVVLYFMLSRQGSSQSSGTTTTVMTGPDPNQIAAGVQLQTAALGAQVEMSKTAASLQAIKEQTAAGVAVANIQLQDSLATTAASRDVALANFSTQENIAALTTGAQTEQTRIATQGAVAMRAIDAAQFGKQLDTNAAMFRDQLASNERNYATQAKTLVATSLIAQVAGVEQKNRDQVLVSLATGAPTNLEGGITGPSYGGGITSQFH